MAEKYDKMLIVGYCKDLKTGDWNGKPAEFESIERVELGKKCEIKKDNFYTQTGGMHPVLAWTESLGVEGMGSRAPGELDSPKPGITVVTLNSRMVPMGKFYEAFTGCTKEKGNLINFKLFFFRTKNPQDKGGQEFLHHWFTITGIAGRIVSLHPAGNEVQMAFQPNRISYYDHDTNCGGKLGWDAPTGDGLKPMPNSPF